MNNLQQAAKQALETLEVSRRSHLYCEDPWYSCPKHEDGCANDLEGDECNCGADEENEKIDQAITALRAVLNLPEQEPVAWMSQGGDVARSKRYLEKMGFSNPIPLYTAPTPRKPLTDEEIKAALVSTDPETKRLPNGFRAFARTIERAHGIGEQHE